MSELSTADLDWLLEIAWRYIDVTNVPAEYKRMCEIEAIAHDLKGA